MLSPCCSKAEREGMSGLPSSFGPSRAANTTAPTPRQPAPQRTTWHHQQHQANMLGPYRNQDANINTVMELVRCWLGAALGPGGRSPLNESNCISSANFLFAAAPM